MAGTAGSQRYGWSFARVAHKRAGGRSRTCPGAVALRVLAPRAWHPLGPPLVLVVTLPALLAAWRAFKRTAGPDRCCCLDVRLVVLRAGHMLPKTVPPPFALDAGAEFERRGTLVASVSTLGGPRLLEQSRRARLPVAPARFPALPQ